jgi:hypothetical protein
MAMIYARWVLSGRLALADVPERWRTEVEALLANSEA